MEKNLIQIREEKKGCRLSYLFFSPSKSQNKQYYGVNPKATSYQRQNAKNKDIIFSVLSNH